MYRQHLLIVTRLKENPPVVGSISNGTSSSCMKHFTLQHVLSLYMVKHQSLNFIKKNTYLDLCHSKLLLLILCSHLLFCIRKPDNCISPFSTACSSSLYLKAETLLKRAFQGTLSSTLLQGPSRPIVLGHRANKSIYPVRITVLLPAVGVLEQRNLTSTFTVYFQQIIPQSRFWKTLVLFRF